MNYNNNSVSSKFILSNILSSILTNGDFDINDYDDICLNDFKLFNNEVKEHILQIFDKEIINKLYENLNKSKSDENNSKSEICYLLIASVVLHFSQNKNNKKEIFLKALNNALLDRIK